MTNIEQKALALVNEVTGSFMEDFEDFTANDLLSALICAIEQHEAFRQEVSDAVEKLLAWPSVRSQGIIVDSVARFIITKPDPLIEVLADMGLKPKGGYDWASEFRNTLAQRGGKIVWGEG